MKKRLLILVLGVLFLVGCSKANQEPVSTEVFKEAAQELKMPISDVDPEILKDTPVVKLSEVFEEGWKLEFHEMTNKESAEQAVKSIKHEIEAKLKENGSKTQEVKFKDKGDNSLIKVKVGKDLHYVRRIKNTIFYGFGEESKVAPAIDKITEKINY